MTLRSLLLAAPLCMLSLGAVAGDRLAVPVQYDGGPAYDDEYDPGYDEDYDPPEYIPPPVVERPRRPPRRPKPVEDTDAGDNDELSAKPAKPSPLCGARFMDVRRPRQGLAKDPVSAAPGC